MDRLQPWSLRTERVIAETRLFTLTERRLSSPDSGREHTCLRLRSPDWVNLVALTPEGRLLLVEQYRAGTDAVTLEIPGGAVDPGEAPAAAAVRELAEETGHTAAEVLEIGRVEPNPAFLSNTCWTFLALGCRPSGAQRLDPGEEIRVRSVPFGDFTRLLDEGRIGHALVVAAHDHLQRGIRRGAFWCARLPRSAA